MKAMSQDEYTRKFTEYMIWRSNNPADADEIREYAKETAPSYYDPPTGGKFPDPEEAAELDMSYWD